MIVERERFALPRGPEPGVEILAIGDIHGRSDLLEALIAVAEREPKLEPRRELVFLGDLVDRGPDSLGAIKLSIEARKRVAADACTSLMGNHETMMRLTLDPATPPRAALEALATWTRNGGVGVIEEFAPDFGSAGDALHLLGKVRAAAPDWVVEWLAELQPHARSGGLLFVHPGVNPYTEIGAFLAPPWNVPLGQIVEDRHWAWVRWPFLDYRPGPRGFSGLFVVHGHTPNDGRRSADHPDQIRRFRLNLDGGSGFTGESKMGIFRGRVAEVVTVKGKPNARL